MRLLVETTTFLTAIIAWLTAIHKVLEVLRSRWKNTAAIAMSVGLIAMAIACTIQFPAAHAFIDRVTGIAELGQVTGQICVLISTLGFQTLLVIVSSTHVRRDVRWRLWWVVATIIGMVAIFALAPRNEPAVLQRLLTAKHLGLLYLMLYVSYTLFGMADMARLSHRFARITDRDMLRAGLRLMTAGAGLGVAYALLKATLTVVRTIVGPSLTVLEQSIIVPIIQIGPLLIVVGATVPSWGPWLGLDRPARWLGRRRAYRRLYPLWRSVYLATKPATLYPVETNGLRDRLVVRDLDNLLYRRYIELCDGLLLLDPDTDGSVIEFATRQATTAGLHDRVLDATVKAAAIAVALDTSTDVDERADGQATVQTLNERLPSERLDPEIAFWCLTADAFGSRLVRGIRQEVRVQRESPAAIS